MEKCPLSNEIIRKDPLPKKRDEAIAIAIENDLHSRLWFSFLINFLNARNFFFERKKAFSGFDSKKKIWESLFSSPPLSMDADHKKKRVCETDRKNTETAFFSVLDHDDDDDQNMIQYRRRIEKNSRPYYPFFSSFFSKEYYQLLMENRRLKQELHQLKEEQSSIKNQPQVSSPSSSSFFSKWFSSSSFSLEEKDLWYFWI